MSTTRQQVMAEIIKVMADAQARGENDFAAARAAFPGIPEAVLWAAWSAADDVVTERWWETLERTIDGVAIRSAVTAIAPAAPPTRSSTLARRDLPARRVPDLDDLPIPF